MKCFTLDCDHDGPFVSEGIDIGSDRVFGKSVIVGDSADGGHCEAVGLCKKHPPDLQKDGEGGDVEVLDKARPHFVNPRDEKKRPFWVIRKDNPDDNRALVIISCVKDAHPTLHGVWCTLLGNVQTIARGRFIGLTTNGRKSIWAEDLVVMYVGSSVQIQLQGDPRRWVLSYEDPVAGPQITLSWDPAKDTVQA